VSFTPVAVRLSARYYAVRRLNPYRGVVQIVDIGQAEARSVDGVIWHLRADDGQGWVRPVGVWAAGEGLKAGVGERYPALLEALESRPDQPFAMVDTTELWLLDKANGLPLALLNSARPGVPGHGMPELEWIPFALTYRGFHSPALAEHMAGGASPARHRDFVERQVNLRARPYSAAQWFARRPDGSGEGLAGYRLEAGWQARTLPKTDFPPLLVTEVWNSRLEKSVIWDYHSWLSPFLLCWPTLDDETRARLEAAAFSRPQWLVQVYRLLPKVLDRGGLHAALVAARLESAHGNTKNDLF
jgi:hypothetical protein